MIGHIENQRLQDKIALARELRQAADDITEGQFDLAKSRAPRRKSFQISDVCATERCPNYSVN
jgi:hypothetical protein